VAIVHPLPSGRSAWLYLGRQWVNRLALALSVLSMGFGLICLGWILWETVANGVKVLSWAVLRQSTPAPHQVGGLFNAIWGSVLMVGLAAIVATPVGLLAGIYLAEYRSCSRLATCLRWVNDIWLSAPSIVIGLFVYAVVVVPAGHFSGWAGALALALLVIPVVVRTTENMLILVPAGLCEAAYALGSPRWKVVCSVSLRACRAGVITGILLAVARVSGETAPLLFTALNNQFESLSFSDPMASLPVTIFKFAMSPYSNWQELAWGGVFLITLAVLLINLVARFLVRH
jgi:phosphate transport system permease protein